MRKGEFQNKWKVVSNPYKAGLLLENDDIFVGRESLIQEVLVAIKKDPVFIMGLRGMRKTSLLKNIQRHYLSTDEYITIFLAAEKLVFSNMNELFFSFSRPIAKDLYTKQIILKNQQTNYLTAIRECGMIDFKVFFEIIILEIKKTNKTLVLIIDDYPRILEAIDDDRIASQFLSVLRGYLQNNSKEFKMILSGSSRIKHQIHQNQSNILQIGKSFEVSSLEEIDVKRLISKQLNNQMEFADNAFQYLMELTNGYAFLVQVILCYLVVRLNRENIGSEILVETIEEGLNYYLNRALQLRYDWDKDVYSKDIKWNEKEEKIAKVYKQLVIIAIIANCKEKNKGFKKDELLSFLMKSLNPYHQINKPIFDEVINILVETDDILKEANDLYLIKVGLFREWILQKSNKCFNDILQESKSILTN